MKDTSNRYLCDMCGDTTFHMDYENDFDHRLGLPTDTGAMEVLCKECAKEYEVSIIEKKAIT